MFKYRIQEGKNPKTGQSMFYGIAAEVEPLKITDVTKEISHATTVTEADVKAVLAEFEYRVLAHLQNNESVRFGTLGAFCPRMRSNSASSAALFLPENIKGLGVQFTPSSVLKYALNAKNPEVKFQRIDDGE